MDAHEIIKAVIMAFPKWAAQMAKLTGKTDELFRSHGREPKTHNPLQSGNCSPATHYMTYVRQSEAGDRGAGKMLNHRVHAVLDHEFAEKDLDEVSQKQLSGNFIQETFDVHKCLNEFDFNRATKQELVYLEKQADEACDAAMAIKARARVVLKKLELSRNGIKAVAK